MNKRKFALEILRLASMEEFSKEEMLDVDYMEDKVDTWIDNGLINIEDDECKACGTVGGEFRKR